jgi:STE24 endopeptidase
MVLIIVGEVRGVTWDIYEHFVIKENHGFNKMTIDLFLADKAKTSFLLMLIGVPMFYMFMYLIEWGGAHFYLYLFAFFIVFTLLFINIMPNWIMPLFNKYDELKDGELKTKIE